jgi:hypothetical protein
VTPSPDRLLGRAAIDLLGLPPTTHGPLTAWPAGPLDDGAWQALHHTATSGRVTGLLAMATHGGLLPATPAQHEAAAAAHREAMAVALVLERMLIDTRRRLARADGIEPIVLKGPAVAHLDYPDPLWRDFGDIDLLVPAPQIRATIAAVESAGGRRPMPEVRPGWDRRFAKSITLLDREGYEIDLHRTIAPGLFGLRVDPVRLFGHPDRFSVGGETFHALAPGARLLHACLHVAAGNREARMSSVVDVALLGSAALGTGARAAGTTGPPAELARFRRLATDFGCSAAVERAVATAAERLGADVLALTDDLTVTDHDRHRLDHYGEGFAGPAVGALEAVPWRWRPAYLRALLWPSSDNLEARALTRGDHLRRLAGYAMPGRVP